MLPGKWRFPAYENGPAETPEYGIFSGPFCVGRVAATLRWLVCLGVEAVVIPEVVAHGFLAEGNLGDTGVVRFGDAHGFGALGGDERGGFDGKPVGHHDDVVGRMASGHVVHEVVNAGVDVGKRLPVVGELRVVGEHVVEKRIEDGGVLSLKLGVRLAVPGAVRNFQQALVGGER